MIFLALDQGLEYYLL